MRIVDVLKKRTLLNALYGTLAVAYFLCMVVVPLFNGHFEWSYLLSVWQDWQTINASMIALTSTVIALNIAKVKEDNERERRFVAAKAFLPHALSELADYCKKCGPVLFRFWEQPELIQRLEVGVDMSVPTMPEGFKDAFSRCIEQADPAVGQYLAKLLGRLQVHKSRLFSLVENPAGGLRVVYTRESLMTFIYGLASIQVMINKLFEYSRDGSALDGVETWDDYRNALANIDVHPDDIPELRGFTERRIKKGL